MTTKAELTTKVAALEARLSIARTVYVDQRARIAELEALVATRGVIATAARSAPAPVVTQYQKRDGSLWENTRVGSRSVQRCIQPALAAA